MHQSLSLWNSVCNSCRVQSCIRRLPKTNVGACGEGGDHSQNQYALIKVMRKVLASNSWQVGRNVSLRAFP
jgi:hypothetical protein